MWFCRPKARPRISSEVEQAREKALEAKETAQEQKKISKNLWTELLEIRQRNNIAAAISARWER